MFSLRLLGLCLCSDHPQQVTKLKELQERIDHECLIRDGTVKLIQATTNSKQALEASKTLFVCNSKIIALMNELQKLKSLKYVNKYIYVRMYILILCVCGICNHIMYMYICMYVCTYVNAIIQHIIHMYVLHFRLKVFW